MLICGLRHGRLGVLLMGLVTLTVATMMYAVAPRVIWLYVASGLHGASLSLIHVSSLALLSAFPERLTESMAGIEVRHFLVCPRVPTFEIWFEIVSLSRSLAICLIGGQNRLTPAKNREILV